MEQTSKTAIKERAGTLDDSKTRQAITIDLPVEQVYAFWRDFQNLAGFMKDIQSITVTSPTTSHWAVELKSGAQVEWDADITQEIPNRLITWASRKGSDVSISGEIQFEAAPAGRGTVVRLAMDYALPGGVLTEWTTFFSGEDPDTLTLTNLKRFKAVMETGEFPTTEGQPSGREPEATKH
jgi:uncharacterized membrane protein